MNDKKADSIFVYQKVSPKGDSLFANNVTVIIFVTLDCMVTSVFNVTTLHSGLYMSSLSL